MKDKHHIYFSIYSHNLVIKDQIISRKFIVLKNSEKNVIAWTDFHRYVHPNKTKYARRISDDGNQKFHYVVKLLNYVIFEKYCINSLTDITIEMVRDFLNDYGMSTLPEIRNLEVRQ